MSTQLFLVPQVFNSNGALVPKYTTTDLAGKSWVAMPFGLEGIVLVASDPNPSLAAETDVFPFPINLDTALTAADVASVQAFFAANNIPSAYVVAGMSWRVVASTTAKVFQIAQRHNGLHGSAIFSTNTTASLAAQSQATINNTLVPLLPAPVGGSIPSLAGSLATLPTVQTRLAAVAGSFGFTASDPSSSVEDALLGLGGQFSAPLIMDRGDGFKL